MGLLNKLNNKISIRDGQLIKCLYTNWNVVPSEAEVLARSGFRLVTVTFNSQTRQLLWIFQYDGEPMESAN